VGVEVGANCGLLRVIGGSRKILWTTYVPNEILDTITIIIINMKNYVSTRLSIVIVRLRTSTSQKNNNCTVDGG
jgi:hypothetical protein